MNRQYFMLALSAAYLLGSIALTKPVAGTAVPSPAEGSSVTGVVKFEGTAPPPQRINMAQDPLCGSAPTTTEEVVTDGKGGLENVVVYISDGLSAAMFPVPTEPAVMQQKGCQYHPHVLAMRARQTLKVINADQTTHNIHPMPNNNREWNVSQPKGVDIERVFAREEISIPVKCNVHPWMHSFIAVINNPYFAVTGEGGSFEIKDLPPGTYTLEAWHEKLGTRIQEITVAAGEAKTVEFVFK
jgi:plastocyanin